MNSRFRKKLLKILTLMVLILIPFIKNLTMYLESYNILNKYDSINPALVLNAVLPFLIIIYIHDIIKGKKKLDIFDYILYILIIAGIICIIFSIDKGIAIFGKEYRHEGFLSCITYYMLFINWKNNGTKEDMKLLYKVIIFIGIINFIYSLLQSYYPNKFILNFGNNMSSGLYGNPNFMGSFAVTLLGLQTTKWLINKNNSKLDLIIIIILFLSLIFCQSTGPFFSYFIYIIFILIFLRIKNKFYLKNVIMLLITLLSVYIFIFNFDKLYFKLMDSNGHNEFSKNGLFTSINSGGNGRLEIWENTLGVVKDNLVTGVGFDNLYLAYPNPKSEGIGIFYTNDKVVTEDPKTIEITDNAHNVYLHILASQGIIGLIPYLLMCLLVFIKGLKSKKEYTFILLGGFVVYSIQAFANISVIQVAPIYYIIMGLILSCEMKTQT